MPSCACLMAKIRKSPLQVRFEILEYLYYSPEPQLRTYIWRKATDLAYDDFVKHLNILIEKNLVEEQGEGAYEITEQGRALYTKLRDALPTLL